MSQGPWGVGRPSNAPIVTIPKMVSGTDVFTTTGNGTTLQSPAARQFTIQVNSTGGTPTLWTVLLEGSLDGVNFSTILTHTQVLGVGISLWNSTPSPINYFRSRCSVLTLGPASSITVFIIGLV